MRFFILIGFVLFSQLIASNNLNIIELYNKLDNDPAITEYSFIPNIYLYNVYPNKNKWFFKTSDGKNIEALVDIKNGYMFLKEDVDSATILTISQEAAVFNSKTGQFLALYIVCSGTEDSVQRFALYRFQNDKFANVTNSNIPKVDLNSFVSEKFPIEILEPVSHYLENFISYKIPRYGTNLVISLQTDLLKKSIQSSGFLEKDELLIIRKYISKINTNSITLKWDKQKGRFNL